MRIRPEFRWWILTLAVVGILLLISGLALDRADVVWGRTADADLAALCPHCRRPVEYFSRRCPSCREQYDWTAAPDEASPYSPYSLSALEAERVRARTEALGRDVVIQRTASALRLSPEAAARYLDQMGRGLCGWCGGTGLDLAQDLRREAPCPACFGQTRCVGCGGDRRTLVGDEAAHAALERYLAAVEDLRHGRHTSADLERVELRRLAEEFLGRHAGTLEAREILFWPDWKGEQPRARTVVDACRSRLTDLLDVLEAE